MDEEYEMGGAVLGRTTQENDLGVTFSADIKNLSIFELLLRKEIKLLS